MRAVLQRVTEASVTVEGEMLSQIGSGLMVLLGVAPEDTEQDARYIADKIAGMRIFEDEQGKMNLSVKDIGGEILLISQFTLMGDARHGRRPGFSHAAAPQMADELYRRCADFLREAGLNVGMGRFGADMKVRLLNDGPVTMLLDSTRLF